MTADARLRLRLPLDPSCLHDARGRVRDYLRGHCSDDGVIDDIVLCIEEACTNVIRHSGSLDEMEVLLRFVGDDLVAEVRDHGAGFDEDAVRHCAVPDVDSPGGRGLYLISRLMDEVAVCRNGGFEVRMVRRSVASA
jgi:serine/threonine-protein kinase RsbW